MLYLTAFLGLSAHVDPTDMHADPKFPAFMRFISAHRSGVGYSSELETLGRFNAFKANLQRIDERNAKGNEKHGVNKFSDLTPEEFRSKFTGLRPASNTALKAMKTVDHGVAGNYTAASVDWNTKGALTPIKNQGQCGSCCERIGGRTRPRLLRSSSAESLGAHARSPVSLSQGPSRRPSSSSRSISSRTAPSRSSRPSKSRAARPPASAAPAATRSTLGFT